MLESLLGLLVVILAFPVVLMVAINIMSPSECYYCGKRLPEGYKQAQKTRPLRCPACTLNPKGTRDA